MITIVCPRSAHPAYGVAAREFARLYSEITGRRAVFADDDAVPEEGDLAVIGSDSVNAFAAKRMLDGEVEFSPLKYGGGYDHCLVVPDSGLRHIAWLTGPQTGIRMETLSTLPAVQLYSANSLSIKTPGKEGADYGFREAVCLETQDYPDAPNHMDFPDTTVTPKTPYSATTLYRFDIAPQ